MKKFLSGLMALVMVLTLSVSSVNAQKKTAKTKSDSTAVHTKKDGTLDKRYKENKGASAAAPAGPTKKDGTADMRYKANKDAAKKKS